MDNSASCSSSSTTQSFTDNIESKSIRDHAGWVLKRVRNLFNSRPDTYKVRVSKSDSSEIEENKHFILALIETLGNDVLVQQGRFRFVPVPGVMDVFIYLHNIVERIVKEGLSTDASEDILKKCLAVLSEDNELHKLWNDLLKVKNHHDNFHAASVLLLQRTVTIFMKSKQQIIREQLQLKAKKQSSLLCQSISKERKPKSKNKKQLSKADECVQAFRENPTDPVKVIEFLTSVFSTDEPSIVLNKLFGKELTLILLSLGLPGLNGKGKQHQVEKLLLHNSEGKQWNIIGKFIWSI